LLSLSLSPIELHKQYGMMAMACPELSPLTSTTY
jgi:hypothetical protein